MAQADPKPTDVQGEFKTRGRAKLPRIGVLFAQFAPYHADRCAALAEHLADRAEVIAVEVATASADYAWPPSGAAGAARKVTLFPGQSYDKIGRWRRFWRQFRVLRSCDAVLIGIGYDQPDIVALGWVLRLVRCRLILMSESKLDDRPRHVVREPLKALALLPFHAALVGGRRHAEYARFLGFRADRIALGYDAVGLDRVRAQAGVRLAPDGLSFSERSFVFAGRFVAKKNISFLLDSYALYRDRAGASARNLILIGGGELEHAVRGQIAALGLGSSVTITGFIPPDEVARQMAIGLALLIPSREEQWGLVVNEALALNLPVIAGEAVGARDALVRNTLNGFVLPVDSPVQWARAMALVAGDEERWRGMVASSASLAPAGDAARFAEGAEALLFPENHQRGG